MPPHYYGSVSLVKKWEQVRADKAAIKREKAQFAKIHQTRLRLQKQLAAVDPILVAQVKNQRILKRNNPDTWAPALERNRLRYQKRKAIMRAKLDAELPPLPMMPPPPGKLVCPFGIAIANWMRMTDAEKRAAMRAAGRPFIPVADTK